MAEQAKAPAAAAAASVQQESSLLDQVLSAAPVAQKDQVKDWVAALAEQVAAGTVSWNKNVNRTLKQAIDAIDEVLSKQLNAVMHSPDFQKLEGTWRGLHYLVSNSPTSTTLKIKMFNASKADLQKNLDKASDFDQSELWKKMYEEQFGLAGGEPFGALVGDYEFSNHPDDLEMLSKISGVAAGAFCPFLSAASPKLFGFDNVRELQKTRDMAAIFDGPSYAKWRSFRESDDSRFVVLTMPRVLSRLPYGAMTKPVEAFNYEEAPTDGKGNLREMLHEDFCWMNASYAMATRLTNSFATTGWCTAIRGLENGGKVENLPNYTFRSEDGDLDTKCPAELNITDRQEAELSKLGFLPLVHYKNTDHAVFFGAQTAQKPKAYDKPAATANAAISARLPYVMASSRIAHYLKVIGRDKIGSAYEASDIHDLLNTWIAQYVNSDSKPTPEMKARYPLAEARIEVQEIPGKPGSYNAVAHLRPWLQMEELTASLRLVASIPKAKA